MNPGGKYVKDAAYAAVLAWKNALNVDDHEQQEAGREADREKLKEQKAARRRSRRWRSPSTRRR